MGASAVLLLYSRLQDALTNPQAFVDQVAGSINFPTIDNISFGDFHGFFGSRTRMLTRGCSGRLLRSAMVLG